ncbi:MAG: flap endonuclease-1 [Nanoarchaeota archaeon]|nr:flap endonuclease-1 [Nanoarchaeota archaeon]MBU1631625.1 flap endonuclease-1 [Nanoarchaeota archaeon]MBU1876622.1 flap endonuclease-1 [Nanoarchaeota archaeon]
MGLNFKDLVVKEEISIKDLKDKILAVDSMNMLYQFLTTIRSADGSVLTDSKGRVTSHLIGLFSRTTSLMESGLKLIFVFDGKAPEIKRKTWEKRTAIKKEASLKLKEAEEAGEIENMRKYSARTAVLTKEMVEDAKNIIQFLGLPIVQAPSEGEAQTAYMVKKGDAYASISQDYDNLIFSCPLLVRNLSIAGKKKKAGQLAYQIVKPEMISLQEVLKNLNLNIDQLIVLAILVGTDYNPSGVKGIGPKTALKLLKEHGDNFTSIFDKMEWDKHYPNLSWKEVFNTIKNMPVSDDYKLEWKSIDEKRLIELLVEEHDFSEERVRSKLKKFKKIKLGLGQKGLGSFF